MIVPRLFFSLCILLTLATVVRPSFFTTWNVWYMQTLCRMFGYNVTLQPIAPGQPERVTRIWGALCFVGFLAMMVFTFTNPG